MEVSSEKFADFFVPTPVVEKLFQFQFFVIRKIIIGLPDRARACVFVCGQLEMDRELKKESDICKMLKANEAKRAD